jgi:hypothetical protein
MALRKGSAWRSKGESSATLIAAPPRSCVATITDFRGIRHSVEVTAESLFEAGVLAISALKKARWIEDPPGLGTRLEIEVREPSVTHHVTVAQLQRWVSGGARSPAERLRREKMRALLIAPTTPH